MNRHHFHTQRVRPLRAARRRGRDIALALAALTIALVATASWPTHDRAHAVTDGVVGIRPATESDFFHLSLYPGAATEAVAIVSNQSSEPVTLLIYAVDGEGTPQGTFAFGSHGGVPATVGHWISLEVEEITVAAQSEIPVPFTLTVPAGTPPGDYAGGLVIQAPPVVGEVTQVGDGTALRLDVVQRQGLRVYLDVAGTAIQKLEAGALTWEQRGDSLRFSLPIENTGNTILHPTGDLELSGVIGLTEQLTFEVPESVLPGATFIMTAESPGSPIAHWGSAEATVESEAGATTASTEVVLIPWALLAVLAVALGIAGILVARILRFVRRARVALAQVQAPLPTPAPVPMTLPTAEQIPVADVAMTRNPSGDRVRSRVRGRSLAPAAPVPPRSPRHRR